MKQLVLVVLFIFTLAGTALAADVTLGWDANTETDLAGYNLYQAERMGDKTTEWIFVVEIPAGMETHTVTVDDNKNYAWLVTAFDLSGNQSFVSNMVERFDRTPPGHVKNLKK